MLRHEVKFVTTPDSTLLIKSGSVIPLMGMCIVTTRVLLGVHSKDISANAEDSTIEVVRGLKTRTGLQAVQGAIRIQQSKEQWLVDGLGLTLQQAAALYCTQSRPGPSDSNDATY